MPMRFLVYYFVGIGVWGLSCGRDLANQRVQSRTTRVSTCIIGKLWIFLDILVTVGRYTCDL